MKVFSSLSSLWFFLLILFSCQDPASDVVQMAIQPLPDKVDFNYHIKPILSDRCFACHGPDANKREAGLRLDLEEEAFKELVENPGKYALKRGKAYKSEVFHRITHSDSSLLMPPPESNLSLSPDEKALLTLWIEQGAEYKAHWSFVPPKKVPLPSVSTQEWIQQPLDHFILQKIEAQGLLPAPEAAKATLLRRATLDLTGLPPSPSEIKDFLADTSKQAYEQVLDRLLASEAFGERMALEWLDVARYADSHGYQDDGMRNTWPWRDWVIRAFNKNMPYDQFLVEQLAGDLLPHATRDQILATCFNRNHPQSQEGGVVEEEYRIEYVADRTNTLGKALMGITLECARCHDHKYDPISQKDYYSLFAFFNNNNDWGIVPYNGEATPTVMLPTPAEEKTLDSLRMAMKPLEKALLPANYIEEQKKWIAENSTSVQEVKKGLVADFTFDREIEVRKSSLDLDGKKSPGWAGIGDKGKVLSYFNRAKEKPDAAILGDVDSRPVLAEGKSGKGVQFRGDAGIRFNRDMDFDRHQAFSVSIWVKLLKAGEKGPIFNNTNGDFEGYRGWICKLNEDGTLSFQLNHVWPDNAIDYQTIDTLALGKWTHIAMTYDGSSKAEGLRFWINGKRPSARLHQDNLHKSLLHGVKGSNWSSYPLMLGKEKERTIENIVMDELKVYDRELAELEVMALSGQEEGGNPTAEQQLELYLLSGGNPDYSSHQEELTELRKEENLLMTDVLEVMVMHEREELRPTFVLDRGVYDAPTDPVSPSVPAVFPSIPPDAPNNRLGLAQWLVDPAHPLTARVQVNRLWMMLFGKGLVATQEDFGNQGNLPSHPELLDWLAVHFIEREWDMKAFLKELMLSSTYRQQSIASREAKDLDPTNTWYSHFPAHRLSAELIRDHALAASGLLVPKIGGPSVYPYQPKGIWKALATRNAREYKVGTGEDLYRRSMYTIWKRSAPPPAMMNFDAPDRYYCIVSRQKTATPLQSLVLMNDPQFIEAARVLAERTCREVPTSQHDRINHMYLSLIGRSASIEEMKVMRTLFEEELTAFQQDEQRVKQLLSIGQAPLKREIDEAELATYTMLASTLMNYDEFVMKR